MLPKWLQPIENVFRKAEGWIDTKRFLLLVGICLVVVGLLSWYIISHRVDAGWLKDTAEFDMSKKPRPNGYCGKEIRWERSALPVAVYVDPILEKDWDPAIAAGLALADPWKKLFDFKGRTTDNAAAFEAPMGAITIGHTNDAEHGYEHWEVVDAGTYCKMVRSRIEMPVLMLPGKARTRAVAHELLHAMGLSHSDWETHLMYRTATSLFEFSMSKTEKALLEGAYIQ